MASANSNSLPLLLLLVLLAITLLGATAADAATTTTSATFVACPTAPATAGDRRRTTTQLKLGTFNTEFMFLTGFGALDCPGTDCPWATTADAEAHIKQVASVIYDLDADILHLNEVEDCTVLKAVITQLEALGDSTYKPYLVKGTDTATGQNAALLTRVDPIADLKRSAATASTPVSGSTCPSASGYSATKGVSKNFYTTFNVTGFSKPIRLVSAHLLADPQDKVRCYEREAQATVLAGLASDGIDAGYHTIISGDLNDWSSTVLDRNSDEPISSVLSILTGSDFVQVASKAAQTDRYSEWYDANGDCVYNLTEVSSLDHILVSKSLSSSVSSVSFNHDLYTTSCT
ncbi:hypothetical protein HK405_004487, partial [Cladochytrium tenue]